MTLKAVTDSCNVSEPGSIEHSMFSDIKAVNEGAMLVNEVVLNAVVLVPIRLSPTQAHLMR